MNFLSDTTAPAHPALIEAISRANEGFAPSYGNDALSARVEARLKEIFETDLKLVFTNSGTAANALALSVLSPPHGMVLCHDEAHIHRDERGAPEFFTGGAKLLPLPGDHARIDVAAIEDALAQWPQDFVHAPPPRVLSLSNLTESGTAYSPADLAARIGPAKEKGLHVHIDGARFANALVSTGASPAQMSWKAGADALSLGATKNGALAAEAVILFPSVMDRFAELQARQKRAGQMAAKMRFVAAQFEAWLANDFWLDLAAHANAMARRLADGLAHYDGVDLAHPVEGNEIFVTLPDATAQTLRDAGAGFYQWPDGSARFVASWATTEADVDAALGTLGQ
ncbi:threonine aldolase family protein [Hyphobacterium marinum]|uniref:Low specificity L-threonine aldolase n=1 Tax=Hyphobacterium marinum TaxID=3116574 RepID=A0ABU7LYP7_9PROT|nr:low specificity L-threonine aldolase [Hyphobacterium sp. Y6023]MEE2566130.1 low specificity L-threonine aldolase [Hyphobacterium sp. Y6023]